MNRTFLRVAALAATMVGLAGCDESLAVTNPNSGETARVLGTPNDAESLLGTYYNRWQNGVIGTTTNLEGMTSMMSMMNYSSLANNCMNARTPFTGYANVNAPGNVCSGEQYRLYSFMGEVNRVAQSFLDQVDGGLNLGSAARTNRDKAFAEMLRGLSIGYSALMHDSTSIVTKGQAGDDAGVLIGYKAAADSAYAALQRAIDLTNVNAAGDQGFPLPSTWIPGPTSMSKVEFVRFIRSYRARLRANMARTPAERAAANWDAIIEDAQNGFAADHQIRTDQNNGPFISWRSQFGSFGTWHQMPPFFIGMADTSGAYAAWIAQPIADRGSGSQSFTMATPDTRFPQGVGRVAQQADFNINACAGASTPCKRYFVNRPNGGDQNVGNGFGWSNYDHVRFWSWRQNGDGVARTGNTPLFTKAEVDLLAAEGLFRKGQFAAAGALVNIYRSRNGLPAITTFDATTLVPGDNACVPKVPKGPSFNTVGCGTLWDALKYEKRIETAYTHYSPWYLDGRGWGDLPKDTPLFWAVPFQDLQSRGTATSAIYGTGPGPGNAAGSFAPTSVYGW
jgi:hypothetical protein